MELLRHQLQERAAPPPPQQPPPLRTELPPFWADRPALWFAQADLLQAGLNEREKFTAVLRRLEATHVAVVEDVVLAPPEAPYTAVKNALVGRLTPTSQEQIRQLLNGEELGDRRPSQFLRHLRGLARHGGVGEGVLRELWAARLPPHVQCGLAAQAGMQLDQLAGVADAIMAIPTPSVFAAAAPPPTPAPAETPDLAEQVEELARQVAALRTRDGAGPRNSAPKKLTGLCYFHERFGKEARKCRQPCTWQGNAAGGRQ
ncbi:hypothetical protein ONE63_008176 [Megalurothrips usitatus]|uniref:DUF7041 domain-containing protein n=1 Tax=Megalurothrips usitatus TaxID=439358 RepID=A0AAV7XRX0_9NEOP|nr:hypothetical protein ONE63_008176 [Megalurothrips usitatus]